MIDTASPTWAVVKEHCKSEIETARERLEADIDERETARLRARIAAFKEILAMVEPKPVITTRGSYIA